MIAQIVSAAMIPPSILGIQRKAAYVGEYIADARKRVLNICKGEIKKGFKSKKIEPKEAEDALKSIQSLNRSNDHGWASEEEYRQFAGVISLVARTSSSDILESLNREIIGVLDVGAKWIRKNYSDLQDAVTAAVRQFQKKTKKKK